MHIYDNTQTSKLKACGNVLLWCHQLFAHLKYPKFGLELLVIIQIYLYPASYTVVVLLSDSPPLFRFSSEVTLWTVWCIFLVILHGSHQFVYFPIHKQSLSCIGILLIDSFLSRIAHVRENLFNCIAGAVAKTISGKKTLCDDWLTP